jgi:alkylation response protein AidB-like acyl-CoA dehydrogenase
MRESVLDSLLPTLRERATHYDRICEWPEEDLRELTAIGAMRWSVPQEFGGEGWSPLELHLAYEKLASASLADALILSPRDSAVDMIDADGAPHRAEWLRQLASGQMFSTIGIAQLTTSRQGGAPALAATPVDGGYRLDGLVPWSTGAARSAFVIAGAVLPDSQQILFALPTDLAGVSVDPPMELVALRSTWTTSIRCDGAILDRQLILRGPVERALAGRKRSLAVGQAFLAVGLCRGALDLIAEHDSDRARDAHHRFESQLATLRDDILNLSQPGNERDAGIVAPTIRGRCNELALRITHAAVTLYKGTALLATHPAQRLAREALFLLVWSCPNPVIDCTVDLLSSSPLPLGEG